MTLLNISLSLGGEQERIAEIRVKVARPMEAAAKVADDNEIVLHIRTVRDAAGGDQGEPDNAVDDGKDRGKVEIDYRGVRGVGDLNRFNADQWFSSFRA